MSINPGITVNRDRSIILKPAGTVTVVPTAEMLPFSIRITAPGTLTPRRTSMAARVLRAICDAADAAVDGNVITISPISIVRLIVARPLGIVEGPNQYTPQAERQ